MASNQDMDRNTLVGVEFDRLEGTVPYGVCFQVPLATLRAMRTPDEGRAFYARWRNAEPVDRSDAPGRVGLNNKTGIRRNKTGIRQNKAGIRRW